MVRKTELGKIGEASRKTILGLIPGLSHAARFIDDYTMQCWQERIEQINDEFANRFNSLNREIGEKILNTKNFASILQSARMNAAIALCPKLGQEVKGVN